MAKYHNVRTVVDGIKFHSKKESERYLELKLLLKADRIRNLRLQVPYKLIVNENLVCKYIADFVYDEYAHGAWAERIEDVKGVITRDYQMKKKLMLACLGLTVHEV